jgi:large subunit ribosomal protein L31
MKAGIHPNYVQVNVACVCGNTFMTGSTKGQPIRTEICAACHPFFTGTQKIVDTEGRVDRFLKKFESQNKKLAARAAQSAATSKAAPAPAAAPAPEAAPAEAQV